MFEIEMQRDDGERFSLHYDHRTNLLTDEDGNKVVNGVFMSSYTPAKVFSPEEPVGKSGDLETLKIQLGLKCNYSCSYCSQASFTESDVKTGLKDIRGFIEGFDQWVTRAPKKIEFWGGEPLLYWRRIEALIPLLVNKWPDAEMSIVTNGSLLTEDKVDVILANNIHIAVSHDGPAQDMRGEDPFDKPGVLDQIRRIIKAQLDGEFTGTICVNSVITPKNLDIDALVKWFQSRVHPAVQVNLEGVVSHYEFGGSGEIRHFTDEEYAELVRNIKRNIVSRHHRSLSLSGRMVNFLTTLAEERPMEALGQKCGMDRPGNVAVDLKGNVVTCQNTGPKTKHGIGSVYDLENVKLNTSWHWSKRDHCAECPYLQICKGACMYLEGDNWVETCHNHYHFSKAIFESAVESITGAKVVGFHGDHPRPARKGDNMIPAINVG